MDCQPLFKSAAAWQQALEDFMQYYHKTQNTKWQELYNVGQIYQDWMAGLMAEPNQLMDAHSHFFEDYLEFWQHYQERIAGEQHNPFIPSAMTDKRFKSPDWNENPFFYFYQQLYLLFVQHCMEFIEKNPGSDPKLAKQVNFFSRQALNALSPSNFVLTNPEVLRSTLESKGENLTRGYQKFLDDISRGKGHWTIEMTDMQAFNVGTDIAVTKGKVIYQNPLIQLIQYSPTTEKVHETPLLIIPPWINKYYILDLRERNSLVKWVVDQGYTVFMISWVNPDESYRDTSFEDYLFEGLFAAIDKVTEVTGQSEVNTLGFCVGGTLLAVALGYLRKKNLKKIKSATFLTSLIDFSEPGDIEVFIDERQITSIEKQMDQEGYLDGRLMMMTFSFLRSNDLYWSYYINNYLCGKDPFPFDLLYWNCDSTNLPAKMHSFYLRKFYLENQLFEGKLLIDGVNININQIQTPSYFISTEQDHIAPWKSTFSGAKALGGNVEFVLGGSGHIAGVVNPPSASKYGYRINNKEPKLFENANEWQKASILREGSWWEHWENWLRTHSNNKIDALIPNPSATDAPGDYVKMRLL